MFSLFVTLSWRYVRFYKMRSLLIILCIALGVATWVATETLQRALKESVLASANPTSGAADLSVTNDGAKGVPRSLEPKLRSVPGVADVQPRIIENVRVVAPMKARDSSRLFGVKLERTSSLGLELKRLNVEIDPSAVDAFLIASALKQLNVEDVPFLKVRIPPPVLVGEKLAASLKLEQQGLLLKVATPNNEVTVNVVGVIRGRVGASLLGGNTLVMHLDDAAELLDKTKTVTRFDVTLDSDADREQVRQLVQEKLQGQARVQTPEMEAERIQDLILGLEIGFKICGAGALVVGMFLVYNALSVSVMERRRQIGILRSVGATRMQIRALFIGEAMVLGTLGTAVGLPLGIGLADLSFKWVQEIYSGILFRMESGETSTTTKTMISAVVVGLATSLFAVLLPASKAASEEPAETVRRAPYVSGRAYRMLQIGASVSFLTLGGALMLLKPDLSSSLIEDVAGVTFTLGGAAVVAAYLFRQGYGILAAWLLTIGALSLVIGGSSWLLRSELNSAETSYVGFALLMLGIMLATPWLTLLITRLARPLIRELLPLPSRLAADNLVRSPERTGLVIAALTAGVALTVQTAGVIVSNERAVVDWLERDHRADLIITSGGPYSTTRALAPMSNEVREKLRDFAWTEGEINGQEKPAIIAKCFRQPDFDSPVRGPTKLYLTLVEARKHYEVNKQRGDDRAALDLYRRLAEDPGAVIASGNFARMHRVSVGDYVELEGGIRRHVRLRIIGLVEDYDWVRGSLILDLDNHLENFGIRTSSAQPQYDAFEVYLPKAVDVERAQKRLEKSPLRADHALWTLTKQQAQQQRRHDLRRIYGAAYAQQLLVGIVAVLGVVTALLISVLSRRRELGLLRAVGATRGQLMHSILAEALFIGVIGILLGIVVGIPLEHYVINVILYDQTGYDFAAIFPWQETLIIAGVALLMATLAGLGPALHAMRLNVADAIAYE